MIHPCALYGHSFVWMLSIQTKAMFPIWKLLALGTSGSFKIVQTLASPHFGTETCHWSETLSQQALSLGISFSDMNRLYHQKDSARVHCVGMSLNIGEPILTCLLHSSSVFGWKILWSQLAPWKQYMPDIIHINPYHTMETMCKLFRF